ncbi:MAG TPA: hypothetical protein VI306_09820 [Pyrinomonadaceae bacterium]
MAHTETKGIPVIDPNVRHVGVSKLRQFNAERLRTLDKTLVIQDDDMPLAVMLKYEQYLEIQRVMATLEELLREQNGLITSQDDGTTKPFSEISRSLKK